MNLAKTIAGLGMVAAGYAQGKKAIDDSERQKVKDARDEERFKAEQERMAEEKRQRDEAAADRVALADIAKPKPSSVTNVDAIGLSSAYGNDANGNPVVTPEAAQHFLDNSTKDQRAGLADASMKNGSLNAGENMKYQATDSGIGLADVSTAKAQPNHEILARQAQYFANKGETVKADALMQQSRASRIAYNQDLLDEAAKGGVQGMLDALNAHDGVPHNGLKMVNTASGYEVVDTDSNGNNTTVAKFDKRNGSAEDQLYRHIQKQIGAVSRKDAIKEDVARGDALRGEDVKAAETAYQHSFDERKFTADENYRKATLANAGAQLSLAREKFNSELPEQTAKNVFAGLQQRAYQGDTNALSTLLKISGKDQDNWKVSAGQFGGVVAANSKTGELVTVDMQGKVTKMDMGKFTQGAEPGTDKFVTGQVYTDGSGNKAKYLGNGNWQEVK